MMVKLDKRNGATLRVVPFLVLSQSIFLRSFLYANMLINVGAAALFATVHAVKLAKRFI